jgi:hypothetical protein
MIEERQVDVVLKSKDLLCDICFKPLEPLTQSDSVYGGKLFVHSSALNTSCSQHWLFSSDGSTKCTIQRPVNDFYLDIFFTQIHYAKGMLLSGFFTKSQYTKFIDRAKVDLNSPYTTAKNFLPQFQESYKKLTEESRPPVHPVKQMRVRFNLFIRNLRLKIENLVRKLRS